MVKKKHFKQDYFIEQEIYYKMSDGDKMPKVNLKDSGRKLSQTELDFMKIIEKQNLQRVQKLQRMRRTNIITGCLLGGGVLSIYLYSMFAVQQERFLDDFNEPEKTIN